MKRIFAFALSLLMLVSAFCLCASAATFEENETVYEITTAKGVSFSYEGSTSASYVARGGSTLDCLVDGDAANGIKTFSEKGIVTVCNDFIKPEYKANNAMADQPAESIPNYSFVIEYEDKVSFDSVYLALMHEINACISTPGGNSVIVEYSNNGSSWTPCGTDGIYYYRAANLPDYIMNDASANGVVEERMVYLGKEYKAKYVRLTFTFMPVPEGNHWRYYTNVYEWTGFTELAVGSYKEGEKPKVLDPNEAEIADVVIDGEWMFKGEDTYFYYSFSGKDYVYKEYLATDYEADAYSAEPVHSEIGEFNVYGNEVALFLKVEGSDELEEKQLTVALSEDGKLTIDTGIDEYDFETYVAPEAPEISEEPSEPEESVEESVEESIEESVEESAEESKEASKPASSESSVADKTDDEGSNTVLIIVIIAVVVIVAVVVAVIVIKKKKA